MTSIERRKNRYKRRKEKRDKKKQDLQKTFDQVYNFYNLYKAGKGCCSGTRWKTSTINFESTLVTNIQSLLERVNNNYKFEGFVYFKTVEHGKMREIHALDIQDRTVQRCYCEEIMNNLYSHSFIPENTASLKNKGYLFAQNMLIHHLKEHYKKYGLQGGIYQFDFKNYFASLPHDIIKNRLIEKIEDENLRKIGLEFIEEFNEMVGTQKGYGVGLGSPVSQIIALDFASPIDHKIKETFPSEYNARYMDDSYIIYHSIDALKAMKKEIEKLAEEYGISINKSKSIITPFKNHSFNFLKVRYTLTKRGKVICKLSRNSIKAIRRKLKIFRKWLNEGKFDIEDICTSYQSWRGFAKKKNATHTLMTMDRFFVKLFQKELGFRSKKFKCTLKAKWNEEIGWIYYSNKKELKQKLDELDKTEYERYMNGFIPLCNTWEWKAQNSSKISKTFKQLKEMLYERDECI